MKRGSYFTLRISISISQWYWNLVAVWEVQSLNILFCHSPRSFLHFPLILYIFCCHYFTLIPFTVVLSFAKKTTKSSNHRSQRPTPWHRRPTPPHQTTTVRRRCGFQGCHLILLGQLHGPWPRSWCRVPTPWEEGVKDMERSWLTMCGLALTSIVEEPHLL